MFCLLEALDVSFQTKHLKMFIINYDKLICFLNVCHFQYNPICEMARENFLWFKWKRTCGLGVVNTSWHTSHPWSAMFPYGSCPSGIAGALIIKHSKNESCEAVYKRTIDLWDRATHYLFQGKEDGFKTQNMGHKIDLMFSNILFLNT